MTLVIVSFLLGSAKYVILQTIYVYYVLQQIISVVCVTA
jgi:hypothetical protein